MRHVSTWCFLGALWSALLATALLQGCASTVTQPKYVPSSTVNVPMDVYSQLMKEPGTAAALAQLDVQTSGVVAVVSTPTTTVQALNPEIVSTLQKVSEGAAYVAPGTPIAGVIASITTLALTVLGFMHGQERRKRTRQEEALGVVLAAIERASGDGESAEDVKRVVANAIVGVPKTAKVIDSSLAAAGYLKQTKTTRR